MTLGIGYDNHNNLYTMSFVKAYEKKTVTAKSGTVNVRELPTANSKQIATLKAGNVLVTSGQVVHQKDGNWIQVLLVWKKDYGYVKEDLIKIVTINGETLIKELVSNDKKVFESLLRSSAILATMQSKGKNVSAHKTKFKQLYNRLVARQNAIKTSTLVKAQTGINKAYTKLTGYLKKLFGISGVGEAISITIIIAVSLVAGAGVAVAIYQAFKPSYDESKEDLKVSQEFEDLLKKTDPETAVKIKKDIEGQIDDAYNDGKTDGTFGGFGSMLKYGAIAVLAIMGFNAIKK
jgi:uncharacterized membrane protein (DUF485 family)